MEPAPVFKVEFFDNSAFQYEENASEIYYGGTGGKLYLGDRFSAAFVQLQHRNCQTVVSCCEDMHGFAKEENVTYLRIDPDYDEPGVFIFDNSQNHHAKCANGLDAWTLNKSDGGKNVEKQRDTEWNDLPFSMQTAEGVQKGVETILKERGCWDGLPKVNLDCGAGVGNHTADCCARQCLSLHPDFAAKREWLAETVEEAGHIIDYYPKFHCECGVRVSVGQYCVETAPIALQTCKTYCQPRFMNYQSHPTVVHTVGAYGI